MNKKQVNELLLQSLEHERGGIAVYETALKCVVHDKLRESGAAISIRRASTRRSA